MSSVTHPKGRLPARVYWFRRGLVLGLALLLVFGFAQLFGGTGSDPAATAGDGEKAVTTGARESAAPPVQGPQPVQVRKTKGKKKAAAPPLAAPDGECAPSEVGIAPLVRRAFAGGKVKVALRLTGTRAACTFEVSPQSVVLRISSGSDAIWSSQHCPKVIPTRDVVVRSAAPTTVTVTWSGQRSNEDGCKVSNPWAKPGFYHAHAAAIGSEPTDVQFELQTPPRPVITKTITPKPKPKPKKSPTHTPSGAVEPDQVQR